MDNAVIRSAVIDGESERAKHVKRVALGETFASEEERRRRGLVGEKRGGLGEHGTVEEMDVSLLGFLE